MNWILGRLREPSTWAGIAAIVPLAVQVATAAGGPSPEQIGAVAAALAAVLMKEKGQAHENP